MMFLKFKGILENVPKPISKYFKYVPFTLRLGKQYNASRMLISYHKRLSLDEQKNYIFARFRNIVEYVFHENDFYKNFYRSNKFHLDQLNKFEDIVRVPIITKKDLKNYDLEKRSNEQPGRMLINTGGTSGEPLDFYLDKSAFAREWAHMHHIWSKLNYNKKDLKLTFRGKNIGSKLLKYNPIHNEYLVNSYIPIEKVVPAVKQIVDKETVKFLHGYPSAIYSFALYCAKNEPILVEKLKQDLKGILLGSEYPAPFYRELIERVFCAETLSWYGHSEMAILAYEAVQQYVYKPLHTYGYCETAQFSSDDHRLIGTSYYNTASPFIRYDTGDMVMPEYQDGLLQEFKITSGRIGEFITDKYGNKISLTALIFGRHHEIFKHARFIQIKQDEPGKAIVYVIMSDNDIIEEVDLLRLFDSSNVAVEFDFQIRTEEIKTETGKVPLLIKTENIN